MAETKKKCCRKSAAKTCETKKTCSTKAECCCKHYEELIKEIKSYKSDLDKKDFLLTWEQSEDELKRVLAVAEILKLFRDKNISSKVFETGLGISIFRDNSTRTRFSFTSACNLLGLGMQDLDETKSQIAHGETVQETANMISFCAEVIGIRDDMYLGAGHTYQVEVAEALDMGYKEGVLPNRPAMINLQCDIDPDAVHGRPGLAERTFRRTGKSEGQKTGHDMGLFPVLRQAAVRSAGHYRPDDPFRHGRFSGLSGRIQPDSGSRTGRRQTGKSQRNEI